MKSTGRLSSPGAWLYVIISLIALASVSAQAQSSAALTLNAQFLNNFDIWQTATGSAAPAALQGLQNAAAKRQAKLSALMETNPGLVLGAALPDDLRQKMPASVQSMIEQRVKLSGTAEVAVEDGRTYSKMHYGLVVAGQRLSLHFSDHAPKNLVTGTPIVVEGVQVGGAMATSSSTTTTSSTTTSSVSTLGGTTGAQNTAVLLVNFQDEVLQPFAVSDAYGVFFSNAYSVNGYWQENSFGQTTLTGNVYGWYTLPISSTTCDMSSIQTYAQKAASAAGVNLSQYQRFVYVFTNNACSWWGYSLIGGSPSQSWIRLYTNAMSGLQVMNAAHELGHALGLYHSHADNCGSTSFSTSGCTSIEYGDTLDFMGNANYVTGGHYNAFQKERLGWLNTGVQPPIQTVTASGTYNLAAYESQDSGVKALKILQSSSSSGYYYVELRQALGYDSFLSGYPEVTNGVVIHQASTSNANSSELLNMGPNLSDWSSPALTVGQSYTDSTAGVTITPTSVSSTGATVQVTLNNATATCTPSNPTVGIASPTNSFAPGTTVNFTVKVTNNDSSGCSSSSFDLGSAIPTGWTAAYNSSVVSLSPGGSASVSLAVTSPSSATNGTYTVTANAMNAATTTYTGSASTSATIYNPPPTTISVSTNSSTYTGNQTVSVSVTALSGTSALSGASVSARITKPNGVVVSLSGTTNSSGVATMTYRVKKSDLKGTWYVQASCNGAGASTSFTVQ